jgi:hypothetical protein
MSKTKVLYNDKIITVTIIDVNNKGYDMNEKGDYIIVDTYITFLTEDNKEITIRNPKMYNAYNEYKHNTWNEEI